MAIYFELRFTSAAQSDNFPISLNAFTGFPINTVFNSGHLDIHLIAFTDTNNNDVARIADLYDKFRLLVKLFIDYRLDIEKLEPNMIDSNQLREKLPDSKIINFDGSKYMGSSTDSSQRELLEHIEDLAHDRLKTAIPNLVTWMDANIGKNSSGFCDLRNAYMHPDLREQSKKALRSRFPAMDFNPNGSIARDSKENIRILKSAICPILNEIKKAFVEKYLSSEELPYKILVS